MRSLVSVLWVLLLATAWPVQSADRTAKGAAIGAGVGLVAGKDVRDVAKGGLIGGGAGALSKKDVDKTKSKKYAKDGGRHRCRRGPGDRWGRGRGQGGHLRR